MSPVLLVKMHMAGRSRSSMWLWSIILLCMLSLGAEAQAVLRLDRMPERDTLCPNDQLFLRCNHNNTFNDPEWRVINGTQVIHRGITFRGSTLKGTHLLVENTKVLEVLAIDKVQHDLHNLRYSCLYDTNQGEVQSNEITVKLHEPPPVRGLTVQMVGSTTAIVSWQQDKDACNQSITPLLLINSMPADCRLTELSNFECLISNLTPNALYTVDVYITTEDGRRSATAVSTSFKTEPRLGGPHTPSGSGEELLCTTEPLTCVLYGVTGVFVLAIVVIVGICLIRFIRPRSDRGEEDFTKRKEQVQPAMH